MAKRTSAAKPAVKKATKKKPAPVAAKKRPPKSLAVTATAGGKHAGLSSAAVEKATGKGWEGWFTVLDKAGAAKMSHTDIATLLHDKHGVPGWWCQMVTVGYEQARGLRKVHQQASGFSASASKTINAPIDALYGAFENETMRARWLPGAPVEVRTATKNKSARLRWTGPSPRPAKGEHTTVAINFWSKGPAKSLIQLQHEPLASEGDVQTAKAYWGERLETLRAILE